MGADFVFSAAPAPRWDDEELIKQPTETEIMWVREEIIRRIVWTEANVENAVCYFADFGDYEGSDQEAGALAVDALVNLVEMWHDRRDIGWLSTGDDREPWIVTGGMTWGDDPTDSYAVIAFACETGVFDEPFVRPVYDDPDEQEVA